MTKIKTLDKRKDTKTQEAPKAEAPKVEKMLILNLNGFVKEEEGNLKLSGEVLTKYKENDYTLYGLLLQLLKEGYKIALYYHTDAVLGMRIPPRYVYGFVQTVIEEFATIVSNELAGQKVEPGAIFVEVGVDFQVYNFLNFKDFILTKSQHDAIKYYAMVESYDDQQSNYILKIFSTEADVPQTSGPQE